MKFKRALCGIFAAMMMLNTAAVTAGAAELRTGVIEDKSYAANITKDKLTYSENSDGTLTVISAEKSVRRVTIPETVNGKKVTAIGDSAFQNCTSLTTVSMPNSITYIGKSAFRCCYLLGTLTLSNKITYLGDYAFLDCRYIQSVTLPNTVTYLGESAFSGCSDLSSVTIPSGITAIKNSTFAGCNLRSFTIPNNITSIEQYAFESNDQISSITIPGSVTYIHKQAFINCEKLKTIYFNGTKDQWKKVLAKDNWDGRIECRDRYNRPSYFTPDVVCTVTAPAAPTGLSCSDITSEGATLTWNKVSDATGYIVMTSGNGGSSWSTRNTTSNSITLTGLSADTTYTYKVAVKIGSVEGNFTSERTFKTLAGPLPDENGYIFVFSADNDGTRFLCGIKEGNRNDVIIPETMDGYKVVGLEFGCFMPGAEPSWGLLSSSFSIPSTVTSISNKIVAGPLAISEFRVDPDNPVFYAEDGVLFKKEENDIILVLYPHKKPDTTYIIPDGVTRIEDNAFFSNSGFDESKPITALYIPVSLKSIGEEMYGFVDDPLHFQELTVLKDVYYAGSEAQFNEIAYLPSFCKEHNVTVHYDSPAKPAVPASASSSEVTSNSVTITWDEVSGATGYIIMVSTDGGKTWTTNSTESNSIALNYLKASTTYTYKIAAKIGNIEGDFTSDYTFETTASESVPAESGNSDTDGSDNENSNNTESRSDKNDDRISDSSNNDDDKSVMTGIIIASIAVLVVIAAAVVVVVVLKKKKKQ